MTARPANQASWPEQYRRSRTVLPAVGLCQDNGSSNIGLQARRRRRRSHL